MITLILIITTIKQRVGPAGQGHAAAGGPAPRPGGHAGAAPDCQPPLRDGAGAAGRAALRGVAPALRAPGACAAAEDVLRDDRRGPRLPLLGGAAVAHGRLAATLRAGALAAAAVLPHHARGGAGLGGLPGHNYIIM